MAKQVMSKETFFEHIEKLEIAFRTSLSEKELDVYYAHLKSLPEDVMSTRVDELIITNKFFPRVSEIWNGYTTDKWKPADPAEEQARFEAIFK